MSDEVLEVTEEVEEEKEVENSGLTTNDFPSQPAVEGKETISSYDHLTKKELIERIECLEKENAILENRLRRARSRGVPRGMGM